MFGGVYLKLLLGKSIPTPSPREIIDAIQSIEVTNNDQSRDGFQISFFTGRKKQLGSDPSNYSLLSDELLKPFNRIIMTVTFGSTQKVLFDGIITHHQLSASNSAGRSSFTVTGEDLSVMMNMVEEGHTYPNQDHKTIVEGILKKYKTYGLTADTTTPANAGTLSKDERVLFKPGTDLQYIRHLAGLHDFTFFIKPTDTIAQNIAFWGPLDLKATPQTPLSVNMGPQTNISSINFQHEPLKPYTVKGSIEVPFINNNILPIEVKISKRFSLSSRPTITDDQPNVRIKQFRDSGSTEFEANARAQSQVDQSTDAVTVTGEIDVMRYADILRARGTVFLRGAGPDYDGKYYVKSVTHSIKRGDYRQSFTLTRDGLGSTVNTVNQLLNLI
jgi:hypothetical protein